jgi:hypothetical protein
MFMRPRQAFGRLLPVAGLGVLCGSDSLPRLRWAQMPGGHAAQGTNSVEMPAGPRLDAESGEFAGESVSGRHRSPARRTALPGLLSRRFGRPARGGVGGWGAADSDVSGTA